MTKRELITYLENTKDMIDSDKVILIVGQTGDSNDDDQLDEGDMFEIMDTGYMSKIGQVIYIRKV